MNFPHHKLHHAMPTLINPAPPMYLRAHHGENDSVAAQVPKGLKPIDEATRALFRREVQVARHFSRALLRVSERFDGVIATPRSDLAAVLLQPEPFQPRGEPLHALEAQLHPLR